MDIKALIDSKILADQEEHAGRERSGKMNPSRLGQCYLRQFKNRRNDPPSDPLTIETLRVFYAGKIIEEILTKHIPQEFKQIAVEEEDVKGVIDFAYEADDEIGEVKSINSWVFKSKLPDTVNIDKLFEVCPQYVLQATYYAMKLNKKMVRLIFMSKNLDSFDIKEYVFEASYFANKVRGELGNNRINWASGIEPAKEPRLFKDSKGQPLEGKYCEFRNECLKNGWDCVNMKNVNKPF